MTSTSSRKKRLDTKPVADEMQRARRPVPQCDGEHAIQIGERGVETPPRDQFENDLGVRGAAAVNSGHIGPCDDLLGIIDLAIIRNDPSPVGGHHRLRPRRRQVDDG